MGKADKLLAAMRRNPLDWRIEQLKTVAEAHGLEWRQPGSSHVTFRHPSGAILTVPAKRPIKPVYIKLFVRMIEGSTSDGDEI